MAEDISRTQVNRIDSKTTTLQQLQKLDAMALVGSVDGFQLPIVDGLTLPEEPARVFNAGQAHKVPFITGGNSHEGTVMPGSGVSIDDYSASYADAESQIRTLYADDFKLGDDAAWQRLFGDNRYLLAAPVMAGSMSTKTWVSLLDFIPEQYRDTWLGTPHGADAYFLFSGGPDAESQALSGRMQDYWLNFAANGDPNLHAKASTAKGAAKGLLRWPEYNREEELWLILSKQDRIERQILLDKLAFLKSRYSQRFP